MAQPPQFKLYTYIEKFSEEALNQMAAYKIPASVILAQAIFESSCGTSSLAKRSNNHFGIKCHTSWQGDTTIKDDDSENECFRKYKNIAESYTDHSIFLVSRIRYAELFKLSITDYKGWCRGLKNAGYATYPTYAEELIRIIEQNKLYLLDGPETMPGGLSLTSSETGIRASRLVNKGFSVSDYSHFGLLWLEEKDILVQSLDLVVDNDEPLEDIAEN